MTVEDGLKYNLGYFSQAYLEEYNYMLSKRIKSSQKAVIKVIRKRLAKRVSYLMQTYIKESINKKWRT